MNQKIKQIKLKELVKPEQGDFLWGTSLGREVFHQILELIDKNPTCNIFDISLDGIEATDVSFPRESVLKASKMFKGEKWFVLSGMTSDDLFDSWSYVASKAEQPIRVIDGNACRFIGPKITDEKAKLLQIVFEAKTITTAAMAKVMGVSAQNASTRLKKLSSEGYLMREQLTAESGGKEFQYSIAMV